MRTASGPPPASASKPASIQRVRGVRAFAMCEPVIHTVAYRSMTLPPGQRAVDRFPRFGTHFHNPPPTVPAHPMLAIGGAVSAPLDVPLGDVTAMARREVVADFHCVAGWSATGLRWEGVPFAVFHRDALAPRATSQVTHV